MDTALPSESRVSPSMRWSLYAGLYAFVCGAVTALLLSDVLSLLADVIGLPTAYATVVFASPAFGIGALTWWALVERRNARAYRFGVLFGVVTALLTGLLWTARFVGVWGFEMLSARPVAVLVGFVLGFVVVAGGLVGLPLMYARRRLAGQKAG